MTTTTKTSARAGMSLVLPAALTLGALGAFVIGCGCGATPGGPSRSLTSSGGLQQPAVSSVAAQSSPPPLVQPDPLDPTPVLHDARLVDVRLAVSKGDGRAAAEALRAAIAKHAPQGRDAARWQYVLGQQLWDSGDKAGAAQAFDTAANEPTFPVADYARFRAATAYMEAARYAEAKERLARIPVGLPISERARLLLADALDAMGEKQDAAEIWREHLAGDQPRARWAEAAVRVASWLLDGAQDEAKGREAFGLARRVATHAPASASAAQAQELERRALAWIPAAERTKLSAWDASSKLERAEEWVAAGKLDDGLADATAVWKGMGRKDKVGAVACRASSLRADVLGRDRKKRAEAAEAYGEAIGACAKDSAQLVKALYAGAKVQAALGRATEAIGWFGRIEKEFPQHRLADDARLRTARLVKGMQDPQRFVGLLTRMPEDYPTGDMLEDGLFELALYYVREGKWSEAIAPLERSLELRRREKDFWTGGRARYFLARAYEATGRKDEAASALAQVVTDHPWSFFAVMALSRMQATSPERVRPLLGQAAAREEEGTLFDGVPLALRAPPFERGIELLRLGEPSDARRELQSIDLPGDDEAASWALATVYAKAGETETSYRLARAMTDKWSAHFPSGKWRAAWELAYPRPYLQIAEQESARSSVPVPVIYGIMREESAFDADVVSWANAYGLMQLILPTAKNAARGLGMTVERGELSRPEVNIALGSRELSRLRGLFASAPVLAVPSYNAGPGATQRWLTGRGTNDFDTWVESIPYEETRAYTRRVTSSIAAYAWLYEPSNLEGIAFLPVVLKI